MSKEEIIKYKPYLKDLSRGLRKNSTLSEILLWKQLRAKQMKGFSFLRQKPVGQFILDFYSKELKLAIEIDGDIHFGQEEQDDIRQKMIEDLGISFLRFTNQEIKDNMSGVIEVIGRWIEEHPP